MRAAELLSMRGLLLAVMVATWITHPGRVIDGDTFEADVYLWIDQHVEVHVRLRGIDAPELRGKCAGERILARRAKDELARLLTASGTVYLTNVTEDPYQRRVEAFVANVNGDDLGAQLMAAGLAVPMGTKRTHDWCAP